MKKNWRKITISKISIDLGILTVFLHELGSLGFLERANEIEAYFDGRCSADLQLEIRKFLNNAEDTEVQIKEESIEDEDWHLTWQEGFTELQITDSITVVPYWEKPTGENKLNILIKPGMAFGTGTHETTQMALILLEKQMQAGMRVLDAGCGNGILTIATLKMGAAMVDCWEIDPEARGNFLEQMELNKIHDRFNLHIGDVTKLNCYPYDLIVSNIRKNPNLQLLAALKQEKSAVPVIFTGLLQNEYSEFEEAVINSGREIGDDIAKGEWIAMLVT